MDERRGALATTSDGKNGQELRKQLNVALYRAGPIKTPVVGTKCLQSNNAGPMLRNTDYLGLIRGIQPADLLC